MGRSLGMQRAGRRDAARCIPNRGLLAEFVSATAAASDDDRL
jgi:hypothetical protein